jgi:hypothetical protein
MLPNYPQGTTQAGAGNDGAAESSHRIFEGVLPQMLLDWFAKLDSKLVCYFLERWTSLDELQNVLPAELKRFFRHRRVRHGQLTEGGWRGSARRCRL